MELTLGWLSAILGLFGSSLTCYLAGRSSGCNPPASPSSAKMYRYVGAILVLLVTLVFWIISMRTVPPFSRGQSLGFGFLIGGAASVVAMLESRRTGFRCAQGTFRTKGLALLSMVFFAATIPPLVYILFPGYPQNALIGAAIGCCMGGIVSRLMGQEEFDVVLMDVFSATAILICGGIVLSVMHFGQDIHRMWWILPALLAVSSAAASFVGIEVSSAIKDEAKSGLHLTLACLVSALIVLGLCALYSVKLTQNWELLKVGVISIVVWGLIIWQSRNSTDAERSFESSAVIYTLVLAFLVAAFKIWSGLGIAAGLAIGLSVIVPALAVKDNSSCRMLFWAFLTTIAAVLFRLFIEYYRSDVGRSDVRIHYTMIGALASGVVAILLSTAISRADRISQNLPGIRSALCGAILTGITGLFVALFPLVLMTIWNIKAVLGLMFGMIFTAVMLGFAEQCAGSNWIAEKIRKIPMLLLGIQLMALQFVGPMLTVEFTRNTRIWILAVAFALFVIWMIALDLLSSNKGEETCSADLS